MKSILTDNNFVLSMLQSINPYAMYNDNNNSNKKLTGSGKYHIMKNQARCASMNFQGQGRLRKRAQF